MTDRIRIVPILVPFECPYRINITNERFICGRSNCRRECPEYYTFPRWCPLTEIEDDTEDGLV